MALTECPLSRFPASTSVTVRYPAGPRWSCNVTSNASTASSSLSEELDAAGPGLTGNEDLLRSVLSGCGDCIKILDLDGRLQFMSEGGKRVMEVEDFSPLKGCPWPDFWAGQGNLDAALAVETAKTGATARFKGAANTAKAHRGTGMFRSRRSLERTARWPICCRSREMSRKSGVRRRNSKMRLRVRPS